MRKIVYLVTALFAVISMPAIAAAQGDDASATCLKVVAGEDTVRMSPTLVASATGPTRIVNQLSLDGVAGARTIVTDAVRYENRCGHDLNLQLTGGSADGDWSGFEVALWLVDGADLNSVLTNGSGALRFDHAPAGPVDGSSDVVAIASGEQVGVAIAITAAPDAGTATMRWTVLGT